MLENPRKFENSPNLLLLFVKITKCLEFFKKITIKTIVFSNSAGSPLPAAPSPCTYDPSSADTPLNIFNSKITIPKSGYYFWKNSKDFLNSGTF